MTKTDINNVSYRGTAPAMTDILAGTVDVMFTGPQAAKSMFDAGKLKVLGTASPGRSKLMPDLPTIAEAGVPGYELGGWFGLLAAAKTPKPIIDRLAAEVRKAVADPRFSDRLIAQGIEPVGSTPEEMLARMRADTKKWAEVIKATGTKIEQ
jgi:tripartite-type tricarboxylate transporter receptor subunit TctC